MFESGVGLGGNLVSGDSLHSGLPMTSTRSAQITLHPGRLRFTFDGTL